MDYSPTLQAYTHETIPELGDTVGAAKERECVVLSFFPAMLASYSRILVEGVVVRVNINMLYTKRGKITKPVPRTELEKLPKTVAYQESFNFYAKKPDELIPASGVLSAIDKEYIQQLKSAAYLQMYGGQPIPDTQQSWSEIRAAMVSRDRNIEAMRPIGVHPREWYNDFSENPAFDYGQAETTMVGYLDRFDIRRNPWAEIQYAPPTSDMIRRQLQMDDDVARLRGEVNRLYQNINNPRDYG